ncbi:MAG: glycoside hydrolase family 172 protein, partial [Verrucomicrobiota bacterium]
LDTLADPMRIARINQSTNILESSSDPRGENKDYNHFLGKPEKGWAVLADLEGPGWLSRFWITGGRDTQQEVRFFVDNEREPRIGGTIEDFRRDNQRFMAPLAGYEQSCWYNHVPVTFQKRLKIIAKVDFLEARQPPRLFYQINHTPLPPDQAVESFPRTFSDEQAAALQRLADAWESTETMASAWTEVRTNRCPPEAETIVFERDQPGVIHELTCTLVFPESASALDRARHLDALRLKATWDGGEEASIDAPFPSFFGKLRQSPAYQSRYFGFSNRTFRCRFPMPFKSSARLSLVSQTDLPLTVITRVHGGPADELPEDAGYLHAQWNRSKRNVFPVPHIALKTKGRGTYVGCVLAALSHDRSWWLLEGDETIRTDDETLPGWHGTGMEDYFNGAWYYKNNLARPMHGLTFKSPFRAVQYRLHPLNPVPFNESIDVNFERGPENKSRGFLESMAYYYLESPQPAAPGNANDFEAEDTTDVLQPITIMSDLCNYERFGDYQGARDYIDTYLAAYPDVLFTSTLRLRQLAYDERLHGPDTVRPRYEEFLAAETNQTLKAHAQALLDMIDQPRKALVSLYCSNPAHLLLDGKVIGRANHPRSFQVFPIDLPPGRHVLAVKTVRQRYPEWVQVGLRTRDGYVVTDGDWRFAFDPPGLWSSLDYATDTWKTTGDAFVEGPPIPPHIANQPHPFPDLQALPLGIWVNGPWPRGKKSVIFRKEFNIPSSETVETPSSAF